jgi:FtsH-binding integral membrane protein
MAVDRWSDTPRASAGFGTSETAISTFMASVYRWMAAGLAVTGLVAAYLAQNPALVKAVYGSQFGRIGLLVVQIGLVIAINSMLNARVSFAATAAAFIAFCATFGVTFGAVLLIFTGASVASTFFITGGTFLAMSAYATLTKKSLDSWGSFLMMGLVGLVIASVVNMFLSSGAMSFIISCVGVVVFTGLTAYDTQKIRGMAGTAEGRFALSGALTLYLDFINLFLSLINLTGKRRD